ncbi:hypothetical protein SYN63AY4M2_08510 [Synechococcus sp. 63AY4M2]|nr:hypothetical protein CYA_2599 [Synechococcus sp. JA-3-3Ab]PIK84793.1 hypothetical protein SYN65AY6A5_12175 [Synechococcus sp. 65AY6A5]PIK87459.1 hypothetical protein SYN63AY4M2_08510 [Synechococcus sp. 63AY4M2]PIK93169.1 hypothetical protein SYN65AY6LI_06015 [Synechococcus sp. 65AY6Li]PIK96475.1 hypothetical protein SYN60AY4M2_09135 [Synechococcus sp. 60AY4M2]PIK99073.1 hypothetical protein SYN63AY4M1_06525 [Synechococcus sp. 63AY4M1]PIL02481.1 hypothetical protein SYN65AY640_07505 [Synech
MLYFFAVVAEWKETRVLRFALVGNCQGALSTCQGSSRVE